MEFQFNRAKHYYEKAIQTLPVEDQHNMIVPEMMRMIYYKTLTKIKSEDFNIFENRISLSKGKKLSTAFIVFLKSLIPNEK